MKNSGHTLWLLLAAAVGLGIVSSWWPLEDASGRLAQFAPRGLFHDSRDVALTPGEREIFGGAQVIKRLVRVQRVPVMVTVIDGTRNRHAVHDPLFCFRGAGWTVAGQDTLALERGEGRRVLLRSDERRAEAIFWFSDGRRAHGSAPRYWWQATLRRLTLGWSGPEPVLVILTSVEAKAPDWEAIMAAWPAVQNL